MISLARGDYMQFLEWRKFLIPYERAVEELKIKFRSIRTEHTSLGEYSPVEFVTGRVKKISSIIEKSRKLGIPMEEIETEMEDIAGIRIMCQFSEDIYTVVEYIRERDGKDIEIFYEKDYVNNFKDSGYRSYHMVIRYPIYTTLGYKKILAEIQIRTLAMNFWATIEHSLKYKYKRNIPEHVNERLKKAADAASKLDLEMSEIRHEIRQAQKMFEMKSNTVSAIIKKIQLLYRAGKNVEATKYNEQFNQIWDTGDLIKLESFLEEINKCSEKYEVYE